MNFLKRLFSSSPSQQDYGYFITVKCNRCGELIRTRVDLRNDLSLDYEGGGKTYYTRKVLVGENRLCAQQIEVLLTFTPDRKLINREASGGQFVDEAEEPTPAPES